MSQPSTINSEIDRSIVEYSHLEVDEKTKPHLRLTTCVLASYQAARSAHSYSAGSSLIWR